MSLILYQIILLMLVPDPGHFQNLQEEKIYSVGEVNEKPQPVIGLTEFQSRWSKKVVYPEAAVKKKIQGMIFIQFIVNRDGVIENASLKAGIGYGCDEAALKGFNEVCKEPWKPGFKNDQPVKVAMVLPFFFQIVER